MRVALIGIAAAMVVSLFGVLLTPAKAKMPDDPQRLPAWLAAHPADWMAAGNLTEGALDLDTRSRFELWHRAHDHTVMLAPLRAQPRTAFVRSGFFHWYELDDADKKKVLEEAVPILHDPTTFYTLAPVIWQLTRDFGYLQDASGGDYTSLARLRDIAGTNGLFDDYRQLRDQAAQQLSAEFARRADSGTPFDPLESIRSDLTAGDEQLATQILTEFHEHPIEKRPSNPGAVDRLIDYAVRHHLQPLDGLEYVIRDPGSASAPNRARLAVALGDIKHANLIETATDVDNTPAWTDYFTERAAFERAHGDAILASGYDKRAAAARANVLEWSGRCAEDVCTTARHSVVANAPGPYSITIARISSDDVAPYVEVYVDDARISDAPITGEATFTSGTLAPGLHRVVVRVVNPFTRNLGQRRVRVLREAL